MLWWFFLNLPLVTLPRLHLMQAYQQMVFWHRNMMKLCSVNTAVFSSNICHSVHWFFTQLFLPKLVQANADQHVCYSHLYNTQVPSNLGKSDLVLFTLALFYFKLISSFLINFSMFSLNQSMSLSHPASTTYETLNKTLQIFSATSSSNPPSVPPLHISHSHPNHILLY